MTRRSRTVAWSLFGLYLLISVTWVTLAAVNGEDLFENAIFLVLYGAFALVGALVAASKPQNSLGWIFLWIGIGANLGNGAQAYATYSLVTRPGALPAGEWAAWVGSFMWPAAITSILLLLVLFPNGRAETRLQKTLLVSALIGIVGLTLSIALTPGDLDLSIENPVRNPAGTEAAAALMEKLAFLAVLVPGVAFVAIGALVLRARRSHGVERQQLRWFGYAALAMVFINFILANLLKTLFPTLESVGNIAFVIGLSLVPIGTGVAVLRYRLFELDLIVNRTLVYGLLTASLAALYLGSVFLLQRVFEPVTRDSDVAVAGSTLAVAAVFRPLRTRLQAFIDRRFYRRKYDAAKTLGDFSARLRDQVDLDSLTKELVGVVGSTMQPSHASVWLRTGVAS